MALVKSNTLVNGFSGKLGDSLIFRTMHGKTFVNVVGRKPDKKKESVAQRGTRNKFKDASAWASFIILDPKQKAYYQQRAQKLKLPNAYTAALTDYMRSPRLASAPNRNGDTVYYLNKKDFEVKQVMVSLCDTNGDIKQTRVIPSTRNGYAFTLTKEEQDAGGRIDVTDATDQLKSWGI